MNKIIIAICEGGHDVAFISRVLLANGFKNYDKKIKDFFEPFDKKFYNAMASAKVDEKKLGYQPPPSEVPSMALCKDERLVFLHGMGGDSSSEKRVELIESYKKIKGQDGFSQYGFNFRFIYFFDADDVGVENRLQQVKDELQIEESIDNGEVLPINGHEYGAYIFHDNESPYGTLENIIIKLLMTNGSKEYSAATQFIERNMLGPERQREIRYREGSQVYHGGSRFYQKKSTISIVGQLQFSGFSNIVFIRNTDFITLENIQSCSHCKTIAQLFS
ncbi:DUF3226 domain-containing protein [Edwardsiella piscicida]|uniref:DUF3226 domain-containing protein n=1 Tax=Edwardsiella piscicida TaxID=1263550 RepID=UPI00370D2DCE